MIKNQTYLSASGSIRTLRAVCFLVPADVFVLIPCDNDVDWVGNSKRGAHESEYDQRNKRSSEQHDDSASGIMVEM